LIILTVSIGALLEIIDVSITNVALLHIQANLGATLAEVGWVVTGYAMASVIMIPLSEWLGQRFGQRNYFANVVSCGAVSMAYLWARGRIGTLPALLTGVPMLFALAMSSSRSALAFLLLLSK